MVIASETIASRLLVIDTERPKVANHYSSRGFTATLGLDDNADLMTGLYPKNLRLVAKTSSIRVALPAGCWCERYGFGCSRKLGRRVSSKQRLD